MENGLQIASKKFDEIRKIYLLEFIDSDEKLIIIGKDHKEEIVYIIWDLYNTGQYELGKLDNFSITLEEDIGARLARTSGNILQINDDGTVSSVLKKVENESKRKKEKAKMEKMEKLDKANIKLKNDVGKKPNGKPDEDHI